MKNILLLLLVTCLIYPAFGQTNGRRKALISPEKVTANICKYKPNRESIGSSSNVQSHQMETSHGQGNRTASRVSLGSASNVFSIASSEQNQVFASDELNAVGFVHRSNTSLFGGSSGNLRYDLSTDGGLTFCSDVGPLNPTLNVPARYPNAAFCNPAGNSNPFAANIVGYAPTVASSWSGQVDYLSDVTCGTNVVLDEQYGQTYPDVFNGGGFCEGLLGEFWNTNLVRVNADSILLRTVRRACSPAPMTISLINSLPIEVATSNVPVINANIAFSPDRSIGWIATLSDLPGGQDSVFAPVFLKTIDNGVTWSAPMGVEFGNYAWIADSLQSLWETSPGVPASSGIATTAFDFDLTVDENGNPHMVVVVGSFTPGQAYSFSSGLEKFIADVHSPDGGATWEVDYLSPILTFRTPDFGATATTISMDNSPQISRTEDGAFIFYSWVDSDTALLTGNQTGIGFGEAVNLSPNLRISGKRVATGERSYPKLVTDGDLIWDGRILFPTMAPTVLTQPQSCFKLPIVIAEMPGMEPLDPTNFHYFGNDAVLCATDFCDPVYMELGWPSFGFTGAMPPCIVGIEDGNASGIILGDAYPNPNSGAAYISIELPAVQEISIELANVYGQKVLDLAKGEFSPGIHRIKVNTASLPNGIYFYSLRTENESISKSMVIAK